MQKLSLILLLSTTANAEINQRLLDVHNAYRAIHQQPVLEYDHAAESVSHDHAKAVVQNDCNVIKRDNQNVLVTDVPFDPVFIVYSWFKDDTTNDHYNVVSHTNWKFGCSQTSCESGKKVFVCTYLKEYN